MDSRHYKNDRREREALIKKIGLGTEIGTFRVDTGHPKGAELHTITDTGIIIIKNARTHKVVTKLIARPNQIKKYGIDHKDVIEIARTHQSLGYNMI